MSMFPTAHSTVYYNEAGEPTGWSDESYFEPDPDDHYDSGAEDNWAEEVHERAEEGDIDWILEQHEVAEGRALRIIHNAMLNLGIEDPDGEDCGK